MKLLLIAIALLGCIAEAPVPDFSGTWKQSNEQSSPVRSGDVTLKIQHREPELIVETTSGTRHALQRYITDGAESKSIGADGDEFRSTVVWRGVTLAFEIVEIEGGRRLKSAEVWSLFDGGEGLKRMRWTEKGGEQTVIYLRVK